MLAVQVTHFGGPEVLCLGEVEKPSPISTEVLVRVIAAGINPVDCKTRRGDGVARWVGPPPFVPGWDVAGVVEAVGYGVTRFSIGDAVYGMPRFPREAAAYAEYIAAPSLQFAKAPASLSPAEAAALPLAALTAWQCLVDAADVGAGQTVLVHGGSGGVGGFAIQIAEARGARVVFTSGRADRAALETRQAHVALDLVGGLDTLALLDTLRAGGLLLAVAEGAGDEVKAEGSRRGIEILEPLVEPDGRALEQVSKLVDSGRLRVAVAQTFRLEEAAAAHARLEQGGVKGKLVLEVGNP